MKELHPYLIDWKLRKIHTREGVILPITNMIRVDGEETQDQEEAFRLVAGEKDCWIMVECGDFAPHRSYDV